MTGDPMATAVLRATIEQDFCKVPFKARDVAVLFINGLSGNVVQGRFPTRKSIEVDGISYDVKFPSLFDDITMLVVAILKRPDIYDDRDDIKIKLLDNEGNVLYLHTPPIKIVDHALYDYSNVSFFHRDIATEQQLIDYGSWLQRYGRELMS